MMSIKTTDYYLRVLKTTKTSDHYLSATKTTKTSTRAKFQIKSRIIMDYDNSIG
nr:hypothetical protein [uncultured Lachnoclostridium sp.]